MLVTFQFLGARCVRASLVAALVALGTLGLYPMSAAAQTAPGNPDHIYSSGPFQMHDGESVTFGMLVPAVQKARSNAQFTLMDGQGNSVFTFSPGPGTTSYVKITFHASPSGTQRGPSFEINSAIGNPDFIGNPDLVPAGTDGILIGLLVPAVHRGGQTADPLATSMQSFNVNGGTMTYSALKGYATSSSTD
ncbi:MAG: hypothetical protein WA190_15420 [Usitatibacter sp.]